MTDTRAARATAWNRISTLLSEVATPHRFQLEPGGIRRMAGDRAIAFWFEGESEKGRTLKNVMVTHEVKIRALWRIPATDDVRARTALELEIWDTTRGIQAALRGDADLASAVTDTEIGLATRGTAEVLVGTGVEAVEVYVLDMSLYLQELEAEEITP